MLMGSGLLALRSGRSDRTLPPHRSTLWLSLGPDRSESARCERRTHILLWWTGRTGRELWLLPPTPPLASRSSLPRVCERCLQLQCPGPLHLAWSTLSFVQTELPQEWNQGPVQQRANWRPCTTNPKRLRSPTLGTSGHPDGPAAAPRSAFSEIPLMVAHLPPLGSMASIGGRFSGSVNALRVDIVPGATTAPSNA